ncbi:MAG: PEP-CTERM sorting domain-containing protein [Fimbriimonadales bacterium]
MKTERRRAVFLLLILGACIGAAGQSFNIDLDLSGPGELGGGAPSSSFGAAAGQAGFWNRFGLGILPQQVHDLNGNLTNVEMTKEFKGPGGGGGGFAFEGNTGDYALLLNDGSDVGTVVQGGSVTYFFDGLQPSMYEVYTFAVNPVGPVDTPVYIPEAIENQTQVVTGPMPGNSFEYLVTHSIHLVDCTGNDSFRISIVQPPGMPHNMFVNGFQVVAVPEPSSALILAAALVLLISKRNVVISKGEIANEVE